MGPCQSSTKKKKQNKMPAQVPNENVPQMQQPAFETNPVQEHPPMHSPQKQPDVLGSPQRENNAFQHSEHHSKENTPYKLGSPNQSGIKANDRYGQSASPQRSNIISKNEPNQEQEIKMGSHFYYSQKDNDSGKLNEERLKNFEYEEHEFKEPADFKTSLHSTQLNRREIFSEFNKNKFIQSRNTGDGDEPEEMPY